MTVRVRFYVGTELVRQSFRNNEITHTAFRLRLTWPDLALPYRLPDVDDSTLQVFRPQPSSFPRAHPGFRQQLEEQPVPSLSPLDDLHHLFGGKEVHVRLIDRGQYQRLERIMRD